MAVSYTVYTSDGEAFAVELPSATGDRLIDLPRIAREGAWTVDGSAFIAPGGIVRVEDPSYWEDEDPHEDDDE